MGRAEAAKVELVKSIFHFVFTNMLCSDWGQSDRQESPPQPPTPLSVFKHTHACPHTHLYCQSRLRLLCSGSRVKTPVVRVYTQEEHKPSFTDGHAFSTGALGGYHGDSSNTPIMAAVALSFVAKNLHVSH